MFLWIWSWLILRTLCLWGLFPSRRLLTLVSYGVVCLRSIQIKSLNHQKIAEILGGIRCCYIVGIPEFIKLMELDSFCVAGSRKHFSFRLGFPEMFLAPALEFGLLKHKVTMCLTFTGHCRYMNQKSLKALLASLSFFLTVIKLETV